MGIAAHNLGRSEVDLGIEEIRRLHEKWNVPWISANATDGNGVSIATPFRIVEAERQKILLIGVLSREFKTNDIHVTPPLQAVLKSLRINAGKFDRAVVLAYVPEDELSVLAESLPEVDAVIGGPTGQPVPVEFPLGHVLTTSATKQGKFLVELTLPAMKDKSKPTLGKIVELDERFADDPTQLENVRQFYVSLKQRDLVPSQTPFVDELWNTTGTFSGSKACQNCHEEEYRGWNESRHAQAWQSLTKREAVYDPDCQRCHVTGYGLPGGFETVSRSADRVGVGCESCHGGSEEHCRKTAVRTPMEGRAKERCLACHDKENSPGFNEKEYWSKIRHGE